MPSFLTTAGFGPQQHGLLWCRLSDPPVSRTQGLSWFLLPSCQLGFRLARFLSLFRVHLHYSPVWSQALSPNILLAYSFSALASGPVNSLPFCVSFQSPFFLASHFRSTILTFLSVVLVPARFVTLVHTPCSTSYRPRVAMPLMYLSPMLCGILDGEERLRALVNPLLCSSVPCDLSSSASTFCERALPPSYSPWLHRPSYSTPSEPTCAYTGAHNRCNRCNVSSTWPRRVSNTTNATRSLPAPARCLLSFGFIGKDCAKHHLARVINQPRAS